MSEHEKVEEYLARITEYDAKYQTTFLYGTENETEVFINQIAKELKNSNRWNLILLNMKKGNLLLQLLKSLRKITKTDQASNQLLIGNAIESELAVLKRQRKSILIAVNGIEINDLMRAFASEYQILIGNEYDISLLMAGSTEEISAIQNDHIISFLLRSNRIYLNNEKIY